LSIKILTMVNWKKTADGLRAVGYRGEAGGTYGKGLEPVNSTRKCVGGLWLQGPFR
jgi:hypothetical protein